MRNTNVGAGEYIDTWTMVLNVAMKKFSSFFANIPEKSRRPLVKKPGQPFNYCAGVPAGAKAILGNPDESRSASDLRKDTSGSDLITRAETLVQEAITIHLSKSGFNPTNNRVWKVAMKAAIAVKRGMEVVVPATDEFGHKCATAHNILSMVGESPSITTRSGQVSLYTPFIEDDEVDEVTESVETKEYETVLYSAARADRGEYPYVSISKCVVPMTARKPGNGLFNAPRHSFGFEVDTATYATYNADFWLSWNHDEAQTPVGKVRKGKALVTKAFVWAHCYDDNHYRTTIRLANEAAKSLSAAELKECGMRKGATQLVLPPCPQASDLIIDTITY